MLCKNSERQVRYLRCVIRCFEAVLGLKVNLAKSRLFAVGEVDNLDGLAALLGCQTGLLPTT